MIRKVFSQAERKFKKLKKAISKNKDDKRNVKNSGNTAITGDINSFFKYLHERGFRPRILLDVGAHSASWSRMFKKIFPDIKAILIEPLSEMEEHLKKFQTEFPETKYYLACAGSEAGIKYLTTKTSLEGATLLLNKNERLLSENSQREVKVITIDSLLDEGEFEIPDFVKLDVQGFELEVLKGAEKLFGKTEAFILEVSFYEYMKGMPVFFDIVKFMYDKGYEVYDFPGFLRRPYDNALGQADVCFAKKNGILRSSNSWFKST
ncbi:MAG: hypothetical protein HGGPFJEG_00940 [Ignavibacteria bacterium]|nr:hypothetical protein [Ignavibacteria bacterium]